MLERIRLIYIEILVGLVALLTIGIIGASNVTSNALPMSSAFMGLLALNGFMLSARTFITFKLHEVVYSNPVYQKNIERLKLDGAYDQELYDPLRMLDKKLGRTGIVCFVTLFLVLFSTFSPASWDSGESIYTIIRESDSFSLNTFKYIVYELVVVIAYSSVFISIIEVFSSTRAANTNIQAIINFWEKEYSRSKL